MQHYTSAMTKQLSVKILFLCAWAVLFSHGVIPHHQHSHQDGLPCFADHDSQVTENKDYGVMCCAFCETLAISPDVYNNYFSQKQLVLTLFSCDVFRNEKHIHTSLQYEIDQLHCVQSLYEIHVGNSCSLRAPPYC